MISTRLILLPMPARHDRFDMIIPDINLLIYAHVGGMPKHVEAKQWWEGLVRSAQPIGLPWVVICGFIRIGTHAKIFDRPMTPAQAFSYIDDWLGQDYIQILDPGPKHYQILRGLLQSQGVAGNLTTDAHLAAIAIEFQCELHSNDVDFNRFAGLRWTNPLKPSK